MDRFSPNQVPTYHVEHLATFSTSSSPSPNSPTPQTTTTTTTLSSSSSSHSQHDDQQHVTPRMALQRLFKMEKTSGIWTQRMAIQLKGNHMWILDGETNDVVERFPVAFIQQPTSFNDQNHIYNNILIFTVQLPNENQGELHIFQCVSHDAINVVDDIYHWMKHYGILVANNNNHHHHNNNNNNSPTGEKTNNNHNHHNHNHHHHHHSHHHHPHPHQSGPSSNVNVKEAVNVFNQIAAQREKKGASNDSIHPLPTTTAGQQSSTIPTTSGTLIVQDIDSRSDSSSFVESQQQQQRQEMTSPSQLQSHHHHHHHHSNGNSHQQHHNHHNNHSRNHDMNESYSNERYVSILNHCFDDIERFIIRLQHAAAALRELQIRSHKRGAKGSGDGLLAIRARGPCEEEFFEIFSKFKLAFNLLAKLKGCIHDPNAPELVHFLFTPLAIIIEASRANEPPVDPSLVGIPYLSPDAIELLSNCCTSKEFDLWQSLGNNWIQSVKHIRMTSPFQPIFTDGWAPAITEPELLGIITPTTMVTEIDTDPEEIITSRPSMPNKSRSHSHPTSFDDSDYEDQQPTNINNGDNNPRIIAHHSSTRTTPTSHNQHGRPSPSPIDSIDRDDQSPSSLSLGMVNHNNNNGSGGGGGGGQQQTIDAEQMEWLGELQSRNAKIVRVLFPRTANNNKELTVVRGEILEVLDDSRKWWKARNSHGQIAHVPHTIVGEIEPQTIMMMMSANNNNNHHHSIAGPSTSSTGHHHHHQHGPSSSSSSMMMTQDDWIRRERQEFPKDPVYSQISNRNSFLPSNVVVKQQTTSFVNHDQMIIDNENDNRKEIQINPLLPPIPPPIPVTIIQSPNKIDVKIVNKDQQQQQQMTKQSDNLETSSLISLSQFSINTFDTIEQELNDRFKNPITVYNKTKVIDQDKFLSRYNDKNEDNFTGEDLSMFLTFKEFPPELINFVENLFQIKEIRCKLFYWNKNELRSNIPMDIANDFLIQRLWSNLLLLKKMIKPSKMNTLTFILKQRKRILIEKIEKNEKNPDDEEKSITLNDDDNNDNKNDDDDNDNELNE
ncbi:uncharacterized protein LOC113795507 isoform X2 [Dermatophagoides pteronyssinus]|uniref:uncharacterized protein LOC113795507 isoform X2 n=1 Tax=Dermatophagoides pteronyssinus TaxID=6956 RepID=UPI003F67E889